jgi:Protein of unknown function (DUF3486)
MLTFHNSPRANNHEPELMGQRSKIDRAGERFRIEAQRAVAAGMTVDEVRAMLMAMGLDIGRSAVGEYVRGAREAAEEHRKIVAVAEAMHVDLGQSGKAPMGQMLVQNMIAIISRSMLPILGAPDDPENMKKYPAMARSIKDIISASKIDTDTAFKISEEAEKRGIKKALEATTKVARAAGMTAETAAKMYEVMGVPYPATATTASTAATQATDARGGT